MYDHQLRRIQNLVTEGRYIVPVHIAEAMADDDLDVFDVESTILSGTIVEQQRDRKSGELKYVIIGYAVDGRTVEVVAKLEERRGVVMITVYLA